MGRSRQIDWRLYADLPEGECFCWCGKSYMTRFTAAKAGPGYEIYTEQECPGCGSQRGCRRAWGDHPSFDIRYA